MHRSDTRILTTHAGSLPRPPALHRALRARRAAASRSTRPRSPPRSRPRRAHAVARQLEVGIDVGNDGEQARESFFTYVQHRMSGFGGESERPIMRDLTHYPSFLALKLPDFSRTHGEPDARAEGDRRRCATRTARRSSAECARFARARRRAAAPLRRDVHDRALARHRRLRDAERALRRRRRRTSTPSPTRSRPEYETIVAHGFVLQIDAPDLAMERHTLVRRPAARRLPRLRRARTSPR